MQMISGAQAMVKCLEAEGISVVFGYPGAAICPFYDCLGQSSIRHILTRNEQNAGHAASGYARVTGKPAVCVATSGPGATNLFTAIATAYADSIPLVAITGQVETGLLGRDVFQEVDTTARRSRSPNTAISSRTLPTSRASSRRRFTSRQPGGAGPVLIDMPVDVQRQLINFRYPQEASIRGYKPRFRGHAVQVKRVAEAIRAAKRPLLCVGGGAIAAGAQKQVRALCEAVSLPAVSTLMGIGALPAGHPLYFGMLGQSGGCAANEAVAESDLLIILGARADNRAMAKPDQIEAATAVVHIDIDAAEIGKNLGTTIPLVGDAAAVLEQLLEQSPRGEWGKWLEWLRARRAREAAPAAAPPRAGCVDPEAFVRLLSAKMEPDAIYVSDVGQNQIWSAKNCAVRDGLFLTTGGMGTMGYALPAALGAKLACPGRQVVAVCGDGAFQMAMMELATANQHGVPVKLVVMRNDMLGMVREIQQREYRGRETAVALRAVRRSAGSPGVRRPFDRIDSMEEAGAAVERFLAADGSYILECVVDPREETR